MKVQITSLCFTIYIYTFFHFLDDNDCTKRTICHENADCITVNGTFNCRCKSGYTGDGENNCTGIKHKLKNNLLIGYFRNIYLVVIQIRLLKPYHTIAYERNV
jgi:hypothetical protein